MLPKNDFERLMSIFLLWNAGLALGGTLLFPFFASSGFSVLDILLFWLLSYISPAIFLLFFRSCDSHDAMVAGILSVALAYLLFVLLGGIWGIVALYVVGAFSFLFFWTPFNILWFSLEGKKNATHSALYNSLSFIIAMLVPAIAGFIAATFGFITLFEVTIVLFVICAAFAYLIAPRTRYSFHPLESMKEISGFRSLFFLEGFYTVAPSALISLVSLHFFPDPLGFGIFFSLVGIFSVLSSMLFAKISDTSGRRREFIIASAVGTALSTLLAASSSDLFWWFISISLVNFFRIIFYPFPLAILLDTKRHLPDAMYAREILLNVGRSAGAVMAILSYLLTGDLRIPLAIAGLSMLLYAGLFEFVKRKKIHGRQKYISQRR